MVARPNRRGLAWVVSAILLLFVVIWLGYVEQLSWVGFAEYRNPKPTVTSSGQIVDGFEVQRAKTVWDWLQLLIIPIVLAVGGFLLNDHLKEREASAALDTQRESALQSYFAAVSDLLLRPVRTESAAQGEVATANLPWDLEMSPLTASLVRARTLTTLAMLDPKRKGSLIRFLLDAYLLQDYSVRKNRPVNLAGADLRDADLTRLSFRDVNLDGVDLTGADLRWCELKDSRLGFEEPAKLDPKWRLVWDLVNEYHFPGVDLRGKDLKDAHLGEAQLSGADLRGVNLSGSILDLAHLHDSKINWRTRLDPKWKLVWECVNRRDLKVSLEAAELSRARLSFSDFTDKSLARAQMLGAELSFARLERANLEAINGLFSKFEKSKLLNARLINASLELADFTEADLQGTLFDNAKCRYAEFKRANIQAASFSGADCAGANFSNAVLDGASFKGTDLRAAVFFDVDLSSVTNLTSDQLETALGDASTVLPSNLPRPRHWPVAVLPKIEREGLMKGRNPE